MNEQKDTTQDLKLPGKRALNALQKTLGYQFENEQLLIRALCHRSFVKTQKPMANGKNAPGKQNKIDKKVSRKSSKTIPLVHNERLEFLGDSVLNLIISHYLMERAETFSEGMLSRIRASLVNEKTLAHLAKLVQLQKYIFLGRAEDRSGGRDKPSILADSFEAVIGAIFLDSGLEAANKTVLNIYKDVLAENLAKRISFDYKTLLQERTQELFKCTPNYRVVKSDGPDHKKTFSVVITIPGMPDISGEGSSIKEASQAAAKIACEHITTANPAVIGSLNS